MSKREQLNALHAAGGYSVAKLAAAFNMPIWQVRKALDNPPEQLCYDTIVELRLDDLTSNKALAKKYCTTVQEIVKGKYSQLYPPPDIDVIRNMLLSGKWPKKYHINDVRSCLATLVNEMLESGKYSQSEIAEILPISRATVCKLNRNIKPREAKYRRLSQKEWLELEIYLDQGKSISEASRKFKISRAAIYQRLNHQTLRGLRHDH